MVRAMTQGKEWKQLLLFALPMMGAQLLQVTYSMVDAMVVGNFVSARALGAVSVPGPILWIAESIATGMGAGTNIIIAQYFGAGRRKEIQSAAVTAALFSTLLGLALSLICVAAAGPLLDGLLQIPAELRRDAWTYLAIFSVGFVFQMLYQVFYGITRALGDSRAALLFLLVAAVLNLVLDLLFVAWLGMGVAGAAWASVISQAGSAAAAFSYLWVRCPELRPSREDLRPDRPQLRLLLRVSVPVTVQMAVQAAGFLLLQRMVNSFGSASIEGFATMGKTEELMHIPVICMSTALASFVGQNMGAGQVRRAEKGIRSALLCTLAVETVLGLLMFRFDEAILGLYNITGESLLRGREHLDVMCMLVPVFTVQQMINGALQGAGDVRVPVISSLTDLVLRLAGTALLALTPLSFRAIYLSTPPAWITACLISLIWFFTGRWKKKSVLSDA